MALLSDLVTTGGLKPMGVAATVDGAPSGADDTLDVLYVTETGEPASEQGLRWATRGGALPADGDDALLFLDSLGDPWALVWPSGGSPDVSGSLSALDARLDALEAVPTVTSVAAFANSWTNFDADRPARYWKIGNTVFLTGLIKSGTVGLAAFTLPVGFRPVSVNGLIFATASNGAFGYVVITHDGNVVPNVGSNVYFSLDGLRFPVN